MSHVDHSCFSKIIQYYWVCMGEIIFNAPLKVIQSSSWVFSMYKFDDHQAPSPHFCNKYYPLNTVWQNKYLPEVELIILLIKFDINYLANWERQPMCECEFKVTTVQSKQHYLTENPGKDLQYISLLSKWHIYYIFPDVLRNNAVYN